MQTIKIREASNDDFTSIWKIFSEVIRSGTTYVFHPNTSKEKFIEYWLAPNISTYVAEDQSKVLGTYVLKPNQPDLGNHIANASYMVHPEAQGLGIGKKMCQHSIELARQKGYRGMQFNIVVSSNIGAINLWKKFGFEIIGTTPGGFKHQELGYIDTHIMFKSLTEN